MTETEDVAESRSSPARDTPHWRLYGISGELRDHIGPARGATSRSLHQTYYANSAAPVANFSAHYFGAVNVHVMNEELPVRGWSLYTVYHF